MPRSGGGREPCHSPKYFGQPYSSLPHRLRAEPPSQRGQGVNALFSTVCATAVAYLCLLFYTPGVRHRKWKNEKGFLLLVKIHRAPFSINSCCCNFIFDFFVVFAKRSLDCQGNCSRCYRISKLSQMLYAFIADTNPILLPVPIPCPLEITLTLFDGVCFMLFLPSAYAI